MSTALHSQTARLTVDDVYEMLRTGALRKEHRVELLDGRLVHMSPQGTRHVTVLSTLAAELGDVYGHRCVREDKPLYLDAFYLPEPDVCVTREPHAAYSERHPGPEDCVVVIEVAYSSQRMDRKKAVIYGDFGVPVYWLVDLSDECITVYSDPGPDGYRSIERHPMADGILLPDGTTHLDLSHLLR